MPIETISFHVPASIHQGLIKGDYRQFGGVVRDNGGRVVAMLEPVAKSATEAAKRNWRIAIAAIGVAALAVSAHRKAPNFDHGMRVIACERSGESAGLLARMVSRSVA